MQATETQVRLAAQLYEARDSARRILGSRYVSIMAELGTSLETLASQRGTSVMQEAIRAGRAMTGRDSIFVLAAAVEHAEPSPDSCCACFDGACRGGQVVNGRLPSGLRCKQQIKGAGHG